MQFAHILVVTSAKLLSERTPLGSCSQIHNRKPAARWLPEDGGHGRQRASRDQDVGPGTEKYLNVMPEPSLFPPDCAREGSCFSGECLLDEGCYLDSVSVGASLGTSPWDHVGHSDWCLQLSPWEG